MIDDTVLERLADSFDRIAEALEGIDETSKRAGKRFWPEQREKRDAVVTRVPNAEDKIKEAQGESDKPIKDWLGEIGEPGEDIGYVGDRTKEWLRTHKEKQDASPEADGEGGPEVTSVSEDRRKS